MEVFITRASKAQFDPEWGLSWRRHVERLPVAERAKFIMLQIALEAIEKKYNLSNLKLEYVRSEGSNQLVYVLCEWLRPEIRHDLGEHMGAPVVVPVTETARFHFPSLDAVDLQEIVYQLDKRKAGGDTL